MKKLKNMIYHMHGKKIPLAKKIMVDGKLSLGFEKGEKIVAYITWDELRQQMLTGPYTEFNAPAEDRNLAHRRCVG